MQLDRLDAVLRPRSPWEAIDLGTQMAHRYFWRLWLLWWLSALPVSLLVILLLRNYPGYIGSAVWWFKPLFEPILVYWLGRALFGDQLSLRETAGQWWRVSRHRLVANLLWRRLSPNRSFFMPISVLERPDSDNWAHRARLFKRDYNGGFWLTVIGVHFETVLAIGLAAALVMLVPTDLLPDWELTEWFTTESTITNWLSAAASLLVMSLIAPFYVASGFALYLSRRTELEAWDIELNFRRFVHKLSGVAALIILSAAVSLGVPTAAHATENERAHSAEVIAEVLRDPVFGTVEERTAWEFDFGDAGTAKKSARGLNIESLADGLRILLGVTMAVFLAWLIAQVVKHDRQLTRPMGAKPKQDTAGAPTIVEEQGVEALPGDIPAAVHAHLEQHDIRAALALLYRASLAALSERHGVKLDHSATEGECLRHVRNARPDAEANDFAALTRAWMRAAYADLPPDQAQVMALLAAWSRHYSGAAS